MSNACVDVSCLLSSLHPLTLPLYVSVYSYIVALNDLNKNLSCVHPYHPGPHAEPPPSCVIIAALHISEARTHTRLTAR